MYSITFIHSKSWGAFFVVLVTCTRNVQKSMLDAPKDTRIKRPFVMLQLI